MTLQQLAEDVLLVVRAMYAEGETSRKCFSVSVWNVSNRVCERHLCPKPTYLKDSPTAFYGKHRNTVRSALAILESQGRVYIDNGEVHIVGHNCEWPDHLTPEPVGGKPNSA